MFKKAKQKIIGFKFDENQKYESKEFGNDLCKTWDVDGILINRDSKINDYKFESNILITNKLIRLNFDWVFAGRVNQGRSASVFFREKSTNRNLIISNLDWSKSDKFLVKLRLGENVKQLTLGYASKLNLENKLLNNNFGISIKFTRAKNEENNLVINIQEQELLNSFFGQNKIDYFSYSKSPYQASDLPSLNIQKVNISLDKKKILKDIDVQIYKGEFISILGPSGSGKSTLLNAIASIYKLDSGNINFNNVHNIGFVFQNYSLYGQLTVYKNIYLTIKSSLSWNIKWYLSKIKEMQKLNNSTQFDLEINQIIDEISLLTISTNKLRIIKYKTMYLFRKAIKKFNHNSKIFNLNEDIKKQVQESAKQLDISELLNKKSDDLSGGQKQRVAIAKAISKNPDLLILDEPFSSLDFKVKTSIRSWVKKIHDELKITTIFVTHDQDDAMWLSDKVLFIQNGELKQYSKPDDFFDRPNTLAIAKFVGNPEINYLSSDEKSEYYIRGNYINIIPSNDGQWNITNVYTNGNYYVIDVEQNERKIQAITTSKYDLNMKVNLDFDRSKILAFDKQSLELVRHEK